MPATIGDLKNAFPGDPGFALDAAERGIELVEAKAEYGDKLAAQAQKNEAEAAARVAKLEAALAEKDAALAEAKQKAAPIRGVQPAIEESGGGSALSAADEVASLKQELVARGMSREQAHAKVMRTNPGLRDRYVREHQGQRLRAS